MPRYAAFLRAINVGGHVVAMERLRKLFESIGFTGVETFIASGNVIFDAPSKSAASLERKIEESLGEALGYEVATFLRTKTELAAVLKCRPFRPAELEAAAALNVAFFREALDAQCKRKIMEFATSVDSFHAEGRELYWMCRKKQSDSVFSNVRLEKSLGRPSTFRGINTVRKLAAKHFEIEL